jgi:hypothetical protein
MVIVIINDVTSVAGVINTNIGRIGKMVIFGRDFYLGDEASLGIKYLNPVVSGICDVNLACAVDVNSQWELEFAVRGTLAAKGRDKFALLIENPDFVVYAVDDIYPAVFLGYRNFTGRVQLLGNIKQVSDIGKSYPKSRRWKQQ